MTEAAKIGTEESLQEEKNVKQEYKTPLAALILLEAEDVLTASITLSGNTKGDDDSGNFDSMFG